MRLNLDLTACCLQFEMPGTQPPSFMRRGRSQQIVPVGRWKGSLVQDASRLRQAYRQHSYEIILVGGSICVPRIAVKLV
jgi:hypothetical protein